MSAPLPLDPEERRERREAQRAQQRLTGMPFEPVDTPPKRKGLGRRIEVPEARQALIDYCLAHPGQWVRYIPAPEQDKARYTSFSTMVRKQQGGFPDGFEVKIREKVAYFRYVGDAR